MLWASILFQPGSVREAGTSRTRKNPGHPAFFCSPLDGHLASGARSELPVGLRPRGHGGGEMVCSTRGRPSRWHFPPHCLLLGLSSSAPNSPLLESLSPSILSRNLPVPVLNTLLNLRKGLRGSSSQRHFVHRSHQLGCPLIPPTPTHREETKALSSGLSWPGSGLCLYPELTVCLAQVPRGPRAGLCLHTLGGR